MTKFEKLSETINNLGDMKSKTENQNRSNLLRMLGDIKFELHFLRNDMRFKWNKKEIVEKIEDLEELIKKKRFF